MTSVSVLVPYRPDSPEREAAWWHVARWYGEHFSEWQLIVGTVVDGPWCKAVAVANALSRADGDVLLIADADVLMDSDSLRNAVAHLTDGQAVDWVVPHRAVVRLNPERTADVLAGAPVPQYNGRGRHVGVDRAPYTGVVGGGLLAIRRATYERVPLDPRFVGWGLEDASFGRALQIVGGAWWRGSAPLYHLWHPPQPRRLDGRGRPDQRVGSDEGLALHRRYLSARSPEQMWALLAETQP